MFEKRVITAKTRRPTRRFIIGFMVGMMLFPSAIRANQFEIPWRTIDGGGATSAGGAFVLSGTVGQPDAGAAMSGGSFALTGGFWVVALPQPALPGDLNCDAAVNAADIPAFVLALLDPEDYEATYPECDIALADLNGDAAINGDDVQLLINLVIRG